MTGRLDQSTIEAARGAQSLVQLVGRRVKLRRAGRGWSGLCPFHQENTPSFTVSDEKGFFHCFGCGAHGSAIDWMMEAEGLGFVEAVKSLLGGDLPDARRPMAAPQRAAAERSVDVVASKTAGRWIWQTSGPARGEIVERWLEARGLDPLASFTPGHFAIDELRFHPRCPIGAWRVDEAPEDAWRTAPAMVAPIRDADGLVWGVHTTFLSADGRSKAVLPLAGGKPRPTRKMWGRVTGHAVSFSSTANPPPSGGFCNATETGARPNGGHSDELQTECPVPDAVPVVVGEGVETVWSVAQSFGRPCRAFATLSLENLQGRAVKLRDGSLPLWRIEADPEGPPFVLPDASEVVLLVDADMKPLRDQKVQLARGDKPVRADIASLKRSEICAALATQHWRRAGAQNIRVIRPRMGSDFNDQARAA